MFSAILDTVAPPASPCEELESLWSKIVLLYEEEQTSSSSPRPQSQNGASNDTPRPAKSFNRKLAVPIEATNIRKYFDQMLDQIQKDQANLRKSCGRTIADIDPNPEPYTKGAEIGMCLEFVVKNKVLERLVDYASLDSPAGMYPEVLHFFSRLIIEMNAPMLLFQGTVMASYQRLISSIGRFLVGLHEPSELYLCSSLCNQIADHPELLVYFVRDQFPLVHALLALMSSADSEIATHSGDIILRLLSLLDQKSAHLVATETPLCSKVIYQLSSAFSLIPPDSVSSEEIDRALSACLPPRDSNYAHECQTNHQQALHEKLSSFTGSTRKFLAFFRWYLFLDAMAFQLDQDRHLLQELYDKLIATLYEEFFYYHIEPHLAGQVDPNQPYRTIFVTVCLINCLRYSSYPLGGQLTELIVFSGNYLDPSRVSNKWLVDRCRYYGHAYGSSGDLTPEMSHWLTTHLAICITTLQLFDEVISKSTLSVQEALVLKDVSSRAYLDPSSRNLVDLEADLEPEPEEPQDDALNPIRDSDSLDSGLALDPAATSGSKAMTKSAVILGTKLHRTLECFTSLVPVELKSGDNSETEGYEGYIREAERNFLEARHLSDFWSHRRKTFNASQSPSASGVQSNTAAIPTNMNESTTGSEPECEQSVFVERPFLAMLLDSLRNVIYAPYELNLQLTALISRLARIPHPQLTEYLLDAALVLQPGVRSLFSVLHSVVDELQVAVQGVSHIREKLAVTRRTLLGESALALQEPIPSAGSTLRRALEAIIVIEEFGKELAAIYFVKYHHMV